MHAGSVQYGIEDAAIDINELIFALEEARDEGATAVVGLSGNYRGATYVSLGMPEIDYDDDDDDGL